MGKIILQVLLICISLNAATWNKLTHTTEFISTTRGVYQNNNGEIWITSANGIGIFKDNEWRSYNESNSALPFNDISSLAFLGSDTIICTGQFYAGAPFLFSPLTNVGYSFSWKEMNSNVSLIRDTLYNLVSAPNDTSVWIDSWSHGVYCFKNGTWQNFDTTNSPIPKVGVQGPYEFGKELWFLGQNEKDGGVFRYKDSLWVHWDTNNCSIPSNSLKAMVIDNNRKYWFGTYRSGFTFFNGDTTWGIIDTLSDGSKIGGWTANLQIDKTGDVWFSTIDGVAHVKDSNAEYFMLPQTYRESSIRVYGSLRFDNNSQLWTTLNNNYSSILPAKFDGKDWTFWDSSEIQGNFSEISLVDSQNSVWGISWYNGVGNSHKLLQYSMGLLNIYTPYNTSLSNDTNTAITVDNSNTTYMATNYGISQYRDKKWNAWPDSVVGLRTVTSLYSDKNGTLWAGSNSGTSSEGLAKFDGSSWSLITTANSNLPSAEIYDICEASGKLWISHREGISSFDGTTFTNYVRGKEFPVSVSMGGIAFDKSGNLWAATSNGAFKFDGATWTTFDSSNSSMPVNYLFDVAVDTAGDLWFGSLKGGLVKFDGLSWSTIDSSKGAPSNDIRKVVTDSFGKLWIPTDKGVYKFDGSSWSMYDSANSDLQDNRISSIAIAPDGSKWFGTKYNGIAQLIDDDIVGTVAKPAVKTIAPKLTVVGNEIRFSGTGAASLKLFDLRGRVVFSQNWADVNGSASVVPTVGKGVYVARLNVNGLVVGMKIRL